MYRLRTVVILVSFLLCSACWQTVEPIDPIRSKIPNDFQVRFLKGGDPVRGALLFTEYSLTRDGKVRVKSEFVRQIVTEERRLTDDQVALVADRISWVKIFEFSQKADELREHCRKRETDQPRREIEVRWAERNVMITDDFDPKRCAEVVELRALTDDLPELLRGSLVTSDTKTASWPRN